MEAKREINNQWCLNLLIESREIMTKKHPLASSRKHVTAGLGGGFRMGNTCTPVADSCHCTAKLLQYCKVISLQLK